MATKNRSNSQSSQVWELVNVPDHQGVMNVGGRIGAALGPECFRQAISKLSGAASVMSQLTRAQTVSPISNNIRQNLDHAAQCVSNSHLNGKGISIVIGGGHDHGYSQLLGLKKHFPKLGCVNIDAHLDLRKPNPQITSGSPFYLALEEGILTSDRFVEFGIQRPSNADTLIEYAEQKKIQIHWLEDLRFGKAVPMFKKTLQALSKRCDAIVVSLDLDSMSAADCPGVSAPQPEGFTTSEVFEFLSQAGKNSKVKSLGIFELNPIHDIEKRTEKVAATAAYYFLRSALGL
jgi:formiminoglutamase